jgi:hypothetical protein
MPRLFVRHLVNDYAAWRKGYDAFASTQAEMGVTGAGVYRSADNPNDVTVWHDFATVAQAQALVESAALKTAMINAGVQGEPQIWITNET